MKEKLSVCYGKYVCLLVCLQSVFLLAIRLKWGWDFFQTGKGKLENLPKVIDFFTSLNIPFPEVNAVMAGTTECVGGLFLLLGLGSRIVTVPLVFTMCIAYLTAHTEELHSFFSDFDKFSSAPPFLFLYAALIVLLFGPGKISLDYLISKARR